MARASEMTSPRGIKWADQVMVEQCSTIHLNDRHKLAFTSILFSYSTKAFTVVLLLILVVQVLYKVLKSF